MHSNKMPEKEAEPLTIYPLRDMPRPDGPEPTTGGWKSGLPIAIDLGTSQTRVGYANEETPSHIFYTQAAKYKDRKVNRHYKFVGNDTLLDAVVKQNIKSPFDGPVITGWDVVEMVLDYSFAKVSVGSDGSVDNPIVMTEMLGCPDSQRRALSEMLFEGYGVPSLAYGIDSLFAYDYNQAAGGSNGLVIDAGNESTNVIPVVNGRGVLSLAKRINWGGRQAAQYMRSLLALKYPVFPSKLTQNQATLLVQDHCYVSDDYSAEIGSYLEWDTLTRKERVVQAPFTPTEKVEKTEEELARIAEKRKESGRRLQEQAAKARLEKLMQKEQELEYYRQVQTNVQAANKRDGKKLLEREGFKDEAQLAKTIAEIDKKVRKARKQDVGEDSDEAQAPPSFPLLEVPDEELDEEQIKEKRKQRLLKANYDARMRAKEEKLAEKARLEEEEKRDAAWRRDDLEGWIRDRRSKLDEVLGRIREKERLKAALADRKSLASQMRMKNIAALASDAGGSAGKRKRAAGSGRDEGGDDDFGANDDDWAIYRDIATNASDDEEEEEDQRRLKELQDQLLAHDPNFTIEDTEEAKFDWRRSTIHMFVRGPHEFDPESQAQAHQLNVNVERIRVPEVLFQPSMAGLDQAGLAELVEDTLLRRLPDMGSQLASNVLLTGGFSLLPQFDERVRRELRSFMPVGTPISVKRAQNPQLDAWRGMAKWSLSPEFDTAKVTRQEYLEKGAYYLKETRLGNDVY